MAHRELTSAPESLFFYWIEERHAIFLRRQQGKPKPWTTDPILRDYKFTNPFRENDRGTVWLRENFLEPHRDDDPHLVAFNIAWYRMFNWWGTGALLGWRTRWDTEEVKYTLNKAFSEGKQVFTGAHIVFSPPGFPKIEAITDVCMALWVLCTRKSDILPNVVDIARSERELQAVFNLLTTVHCVGGFMAYEMVTDMRHTKLLEDATDIMTWANPGPGARRGLQRLGLPSKGDAAIREIEKLMIKGNNYWLCPSGLRVEMRDIEHSLCEFDKYCRVKFNEGEPRSKYPGAA